MNPIAIDINGQEWSFGKSWGYMKGNKGKVARVTLYFNRIPAGIDKIGFCMPNSFSWDKIPVDDNPDQVTHSDWDEGALRSYWESNKCGNIEGIYCFVSTNDKNWWGQNKHTFAIIKDGYQYDVVYIKGSNKGIWKEGDIKATFVPTATPGLYKATSWFMESRVEHDDFYLKFNNGSMTIFENTDKVSAEFLKLYPANDINDVASKDNSSAAGSSNSTYQNSPSAPKGSGSGIFVGEKIIATNYHVIEGAKKIEVSVRTGNSVSTYTANVLSSDKTNDLALISIDDKGFGGIGHIPFAVSGKTCDVGTSIFTMGYPMSDYMGEEVKITDGIISSKTGFEGDIVTYQISAPIQPGNSGGPLFDKHGNLVGITNAGIVSAQNVGYAIKSSYLYNLIESAPISIEISENSEIDGQELPDQIKTLSKYVVIIKVY